MVYHSQLIVIALLKSQTHRRRAYKSQPYMRFIGSYSLPNQKHFYKIVVFNEWYARDISKKRRIGSKIKGNAREPMGQPPYGYRKDPDNLKHWIVDEETAEVVRRIYHMSLDGKGTEQITTVLSEEHILTPRFYWESKGVKRPGKPVKYGPCHWNSSTVTKIPTL